MKRYFVLTDGLHEILLFFNFYLFNSSGASSLNYRGNCTVKVSHVCREIKTPVKKTEFSFMDGETQLLTTCIWSLK